MLTIKQEETKSVHVIILEGILNADTSPQLENILEPFAGTDNPCLLVHFPDLTYISSAGIGCFIGVIKRIRDHNGDIRFSNPTATVKRVFTLLNMDDFFQFYPSLEEGIHSYNL
jgi:anti-sigma B factor antagonist